MDGGSESESESESETLVEESVELCDSPSVLTGLFQICRSSSQIEPNVERVSRVVEHQHEEFSTSPADLSSNEKDSESLQAPSPNGASIDNSSQQSQKSQSIFTQRIPGKRKSPIVTLCSPVFAQAPSLKLPRIMDDTSSSTDTHLSVQSSSFQEDRDQDVNQLTQINIKSNQQTQSSLTTIPSEQGITPEPKHPPLAESKHSQATPSTPTPESPNLVRRKTHPLDVLEPAPRQNSISLNVLSSSQLQTAPTLITTDTFNSSLPNPTYHSFGSKTVNSNSGSGLGSVTVAHFEENFDVGSQRSDDDASLIEMEKMQQKIREMMRNKEKDVKNSDQIKRSLQDMQARLRHLSARQREHRQQLGILLKQQAATPSSQQQQQEARTQVQNMTRRQQQLLKLLQSHKELAAALQQRQNAEYFSLAQRISSGKSNAIIYKPQESKPISITQTPSHNDPSNKSPLPRQEAILNLPSTQVSKIKTQSKPMPEISLTRTFKPPFKANSSKTLHQVKPPSPILADDSSNLQPNQREEEIRSQSLQCFNVRDMSPIINERSHQPNPPNSVYSSSNSRPSPGKDELKSTFASIPDKSKSIPCSLDRDTVSIDKDIGRSPLQSHPYSPASGISNDEYLSETTGLHVEKGFNGDLRGKNQNGEPSDRDFSLRTGGFLVDSLKKNAVSTKMAQNLAVELPNTSNLPDKTTRTTKTPPNVSATNQAPVPVSQDPSSKISREATQETSFQTYCVSVDSMAKRNATNQRTEKASILPEKLSSTANHPALSSDTKETMPISLTYRPPVQVFSTPVSEFSQTIKKTSAITVNTQTLVSQLPTSIQNKEVNFCQSTDTSGSTSALSQPTKVVVYKINASSLKDRGTKALSKSTLDARASSLSVSGTVPANFQVEKVGSTTLPQSNSIPTWNQRQQRRQNQSLSSSSNSLALTQFQTLATSSLNIPSSTCSPSDPRAIASTTLSTTAAQSKRSSSKTGKEATCIIPARTETQTSGNHQLATSKTLVASSQAKTTVDHSSRKNQRPPNCNSKSSSDEEDIPSLQNLLQKRLVNPGENVLSIKLKKDLVTGSLNSDGTVHPTTPMKNLPSESTSLCHMVSVVKHRSLSWIRKNPSIWESVFYKGKPLNKLHTDYKVLIAKDLQSLSQANAGNQAMQGKDTTTKTNIQSSIQEPASSRTHPDSSHPPPPPSQQYTTALTSQDLFKGPSSRGYELMIPGHHISPTTQNVNCSISVGLVSSMEKVLIISDNELLPASWGILSNVSSVDDFQNASICQKWIDEMDVWS